MCENLYTFYRSRCEKYSDCMLFDNAITYGRAFELAMARAAFLQKKGYKQNDVIALLAKSSPEWCITYMAITSIGAVVLPLDTSLPPASYPAMLKKVGAKAAFVSAEFKKTLKAIPVFEVDLGKSMGDPSKARPALVKEDHTASLVFTSGTTGNPKIVTLTHRNIFRTAIATSEYLELRPGDVNLCILPLFHVYALDANFIGPFAAGGALVFQPSLKGPDIMKSLAENPITIFPAAPQLWELFMDAIISRVKAQSMNKYRVFMFFLTAAPVLRALGLGFLLKKVFKPVHDIFGASHRFFISGGAPLKRKYAIYYRNMGFTLIEGYGLSETTGPITLPSHKKNVLGSVGKPTPGNFVKIANANDEGIGEVRLKGDSVMPGYYKNPEANRGAFDEEGYFNTGDLGRLDRKGNLFLTGRSKNVIVLDSGKNIYPEELESHYKQSALISEIAVIGKRIDGRETAYAVIVPSKKNDSSYAEIRAELARLSRFLPGYKMIRNFALSFDPLPVNTTRKVLYSEVAKNLDRGLYKTSEDDSVVLQRELAAATPREEMIVQALKRKLKTKTIYASQTFADYNIDSLGLIDLIVFLEGELNITIDSQQVAKLQTMEEFLLYLASCGENTGQSIEERIFRGDIATRPYRFFNPFHHPIIGLFGILSRLFWKLHTVHPERLVFDNNIIIANHESYLDAVWLAAQIPKRFRNDIYATGKKKLSFLRFFFPMFPIIFIDEENSIPALKASADMLRQGKSLMIFPEGTRSRSGKLGEFRTGAAYLAKNLGKKIIPISINGSYDIYPPHKLIPEFFTKKKGCLVVGETIDPADFKSIDQLNEAMRNAIKQNLYKENPPHN